MVRGQVMREEGRAWSMGRLRSSDYFAQARERAVARASDAVRRRLRRSAGEVPDEDDRALS